MHQLFKPGDAFIADPACGKHIVAQTKRKANVFKLFKQDSFLIVEDTGYLEADGVGADVDSSKFHYGKITPLFFLFSPQLFFFALTYPERPRFGPKDVLASYPDGPRQHVVLNPILMNMSGKDK